ncbi:MAG: DUF3168 domain-containing protein [Caulobacteraceae bacterium]
MSFDLGLGDKDVSIALQGGVYRALSTVPALANLLGNSLVFDQVAAGIDPPYATLGDDEIEDESAEGLEGSVRATVSVHIWSAGPGYGEAKTIAGAAKAALCKSLDLGDDGFRITAWKFQRMHPVPDPGGELWPVVLSVIYHIDPIA